MIDYTTASITYDNTRTSDERVIAEFAKGVDLGSCAFLDFGCGTGNYLAMIREETGNSGCGVEPSEGMREKARLKNPGCEILEGNHSSIPFGDTRFDFAYMTDVIHHVPDLDALFAELWRVLKRGGKLCVVTQSWKQIEARWYNRYFPSLVANEQGRYPDIGTIAAKASARGLALERVTILEAGLDQEVTAEFIRTVEQKNFSMFRMISELELERGLAALRQDLGKTLLAPGRGDSLVWLKKA